MSGFNAVAPQRRSMGGTSKFESRVVKVYEKLVRENYGSLKRC
jgi:hypothetical protein